MLGHNNDEKENRENINFNKTKQNKSSNMQNPKQC